MWLGRAVGIALIVLAASIWLFSPSPDCNPMQLFGCGLLDLGISGVIGTTLRWLIISVIAAVGIMLWKWKPAANKPQDTTTDVK